MEKYEVLNTIAVLAFVFLVIGLLSGHFFWFWLAMILLFTHLISFSISSVIARLWMKFAHFIGKFNTRILLTVIFFVFLTPIAILYRFFNARKNAVFFKDQRSSYFDDVAGSSVIDFTKQW